MSLNNMIEKFKKPLNFITNNNYKSCIYEQLFTKSSDAIFLLDEYGNVLSANKNFVNLLGYKIRKIKSIKKDFIYDNYEKYKYHLNLAKNKIPSSFNIVLIHKKGHHITVDMTLIPSISKGKLNIYGICKDLTKIELYDYKIERLYNSLEKTQKAANVGMWNYDIQQDEIILSKQVYKVFGLNADSFKLTPKNIFKHVHPDDRLLFKRALKKSIHQRQGHNTEYRLVMDNGEVKSIVQNVEVITDNSGDAIQLIGTIHDITSKKQIEEKLNTYRTQLHSIADQLHVGIWSMDKVSKKIVYLNNEIENIYGVPLNTFKSNPSLWLEFVHPDDRLKVENNIQKFMRGIEVTTKFRIIDNYGTIKWLFVHVTPYVDDSGDLKRIDGFIQDITEEKNHTERLTFYANHDQITELPNRRYLVEHIKKVIEKTRNSGGTFALLKLDLDRFKTINNAFGLEFGDKLFGLMSERLKDILPKDSFCARLYGNKFAILINNLDNDSQYLKVAEKINQEIEKPFYIDGYEIFTTVSIGVSIYPFDGSDFDTLIKNASNAMYIVKKMGGNDCKAYSDSMNIESFKRYQLERDMQKAIMNDEFYIEYQPKVDIKTGRIMSAEALVRWNHPEWGIVPPEEFIPLAEENCCIFRIGDWILNETCQLLGKWQEEGLPMIPISVNISPKRLLKANFVNSVKEAIAKANIDPSLIEIELTECAIIKNIDVTKEVISELKQYGVRFALDDFGTGYSSLSHIMELDIDTIKIDKSFIDGIGNKKESEGIIKSIIFLAKQLDIQVIAEGVETKPQLNFLLQQECSQVQGFIYSDSVKTTTLVKLINNKYLKPSNTLVEDINFQNRRKYFRLNFNFPLQADMTIIKFKNKDVKLGHSRALIKDLSIGGMQFISDINLPVQDNLILEFTTTILGKQVKFQGRIVWKMTEGDLWVYGFEFEMTAGERDNFAPLFNQLLLQLKSNPLVDGCEFLKGSKRKYFKMA